MGKSKVDDRFGIPERICDGCGKPFCPAPEHMYTVGSRQRKRWYCRYTCMLRDLRKREKEAAHSEVP